jgi:hypothetical protein
LFSPAHDAQKWQNKPVNHANCTSVGLWVTQGDALIFLLKIKTGTLFGHSSSTQCLHAASSGTKRINNNKNSRTRGGKSGGVEDQRQPVVA